MNNAATLIARKQDKCKVASDHFAASNASAILPDNLVGRRPEPEGVLRGAQVPKAPRMQENVVVVRLKKGNNL